MKLEKKQSLCRLSLYSLKKRPLRRLFASAVIAHTVLLSWPGGVHAQVNLTGSYINWSDQDRQIRVPGPDLQNYLGLPINEDARAIAQAYTPGNIGKLHRQCVPWPVHYIVVGPTAMEIWPTKRVDGSVLAWNIGGASDRQPLTIWMDGRQSPSPQAANSSSGFTTGQWQGDTLVTTTTHIQNGYLYRNGVPNSDKEVFTMFITRHDNWLSITGIVHDPVYLTAPYVLSAILTTDNTVETGSENSLDYTCTPAEEDEQSASSNVPSYLTVPTDILTYATTHYGIPLEAAFGGEQTMYPEYIKEIASKYQRPEGYCPNECCGSQGPDGRSAIEYHTQVLMCRERN